MSNQFVLYKYCMERWICYIISKLKEVRKLQNITYSDKDRKRLGSSQDTLYFTLMLMVSCQKGPTRHAYSWQIGPF